MQGILACGWSLKVAVPRYAKTIENNGNIACESQAICTAECAAQFLFAYLLGTAW